MPDVTAANPDIATPELMKSISAAFNSREELFADWRERNAPQTWSENWWFADAGTIERGGVRSAQRLFFEKLMGAALVLDRGRVVACAEQPLAFRLIQRATPRVLELRHDIAELRLVRRLSGKVARATILPGDGNSSYRGS